MNPEHPSTEIQRPNFLEVRGFVCCLIYSLDFRNLNGKSHNGNNQKTVGMEFWKFAT